MDKSEKIKMNVDKVMEVLKDCTQAECYRILNDAQVRVIAKWKEESQKNKKEDDEVGLQDIIEEEKIRAEIVDEAESNYDKFDEDEDDMEEKDDDVECI